MKKTVSITLAIAATMILSTASPAFSRDRVVVRKGDDPAKIKVVEKKSPYIGIYMDDLNDKLIKDLNYPESDGVWIISVIEDSPAEKAGLEDDDIIYIIDGEKLEGVSDIGEILKGKEVGDPVKMVIYRDGRKKELVVELGEHAKQFYTMDIRDDRTSGREITMPSFTIAEKYNQQAMDMLREMGGNRLYMGVRIHDMSPDLAGYFKVDKGVLVLDVLEDTPAAKAGIRGGDVITEAAGEKIVESGDLLDALGDVEDDVEKIEIAVLRKGERMTFTFDREDLENQSSTLWISPNEGDFKHFKLNIPEIKKMELEGQKAKLLERDVELERLRSEIDTLEKRLRKLEKNTD
ncbi:MAG: PDZ domain-containing protein [Candidatus Krumholzibacteria bacterium]|nr:PDZ domain-containing protein [Candidatus Krumholzibacteria bacterium]